ncbi:DUF551 domain-containing protein [Xenorhabdus griffiniae]|uniref:DUF551 domain-containing protein n=1 Tax=Xenorhabdus griffiniae TaxID=351672 RepID=A0ABY9XM46_9GAMM|nr:DUF551 domain-containing protein [Xenorhabdus griffiniae]WMV74007.1 DUF551 domain-containing protein [Xenorhabdus griffiniae]WNH03687.1 DUF551 domain-containing protein [Xenorhabdus griffiniae]
MPKTGQTVIIHVDSDSEITSPLIGEMVWTGSTFRRNYVTVGTSSPDNIVVTHWMPLPEPPRDK